MALHVTAVSPTAFSYLTLYPDGAPQPAAPDLDFPAGQNLSNLVVEQVSSSGTINVFNNAGDVDVVVDLVGYYTRVKPDIVGLLDRGSAPTQATGGSNFTAPATLVSSQGSWAGNPISGIVVNETLADLQPTAAYEGRRTSFSRPWTPYAAPAFRAGRTTSISRSATWTSGTMPTPPALCTSS